MTWPVAVDCLGGTPYLPWIAPPEPTAFHAQTKAYLTPERNAPEPGSILFFGDSLTQAMCVNTIPAALNLGIGGESFRSLMHRLNGTLATRQAGACVLLSGICDLGNTEYYTQGDAPATVNWMYSQFAKWMTGKWVIVKLLPCAAPCGISNADIATVNAKLQQLFSTRPGVALVDVTAQLGTPLKSAYHIGDGQHLNGAGYAILTAAIKAALTTIL